MITREYLEQRIQELTVARTKHQGDVDANNGAIQLAQYLLADLVKAEAEPEDAGEGLETFDEAESNGLDASP